MSCLCRGADILFVCTSGLPECPNIILYYIILYYLLYITMVYCNLHCIHGTEVYMDCGVTLPQALRALGSHDSKIHIHLSAVV